MPPFIKSMAIDEGMWKLGVLADTPDFKKFQEIEANNIAI